MSLFKTTYTRQFHTLSVKDTKRKNESCFTDVFGDSVDLELLIPGVDYNEGFLAVLIDEAPEEVISVLSLVLNCPMELYDLLSEMWRSKGKKKEHGNQFLCEMLGYDCDEVDLVKMVQEYFR